MSLGLSMIRIKYTWTNPRIKKKQDNRFATSVVNIIG